MDRRVQDAARLNEPGDIEQQAQLLREKMRAGDIEKNKVEFAAFLGDVPARQIVSEEDYQVSNFRVSENSVEAFFSDVVEKFGILAYTAMMTEVLKEYQYVYLAYKKINGLETEPTSVNLVFEELHKMLEKNRLDQIKLNHLKHVLKEEIYSHQDRIVNNQDANLEEMYGETPDDQVGLGMLHSLASLLDEISENPDHSMYDSPYEALFSTYVSFGAGLSAPLLAELPESLRSNLERTMVTRNDDVLETDYDAIDQMFLKMMKKGGLKWALKDVK